MPRAAFVFVAPMLLTQRVQWEYNPRSYIILLTHSFTHYNGATQAIEVAGEDVLPEPTVAAER